MRRYLTSIVLALALPVLGLAQTGVPPFGSFSKGQFDAINNANLNVIFAIPITSSPGRGLNLSLSAVYNSQVWAPEFNGGGALAWTKVAGWQLNSPTGKTSYQMWTTTGSCGRLGDGGYTDTFIFDQYIYLDPLGTPHPFNISVHEFYSSCTDTTTYSGTYSGQATDNSGYYASISNPSVSLIPTIISKSGVVISPSGMTMTDANGNFLSGIGNSSETDWTDTVGRTALKIITGSTSIQYQFLDPTGNYQTTTVNLASFNVKTNFGCSNVIEYSAQGKLPTSLVLPNGQTYQFSYEPTPGYSGYYTGRVKKVTLPTGGSYEYDYTGSFDGINCSDGSTMGLNEVVSDGTNNATWKYVRSGATTTVTTPQLADTPNANDTVITFNSSGQETQRKVYKESPGVNLLRTINATRAANSTPATQVTILEDGATQSEVATTYDSNGLLDSVSEYNWGSGSPGSLFRTTTYAYQTSTNYTSRNILDLVTSKQVKDGSGAVQYRQDIAYDATAGDNQSCPTGVPQHNDTSYGCSFFYRGNPTSVTTYLTPATPANPITKNLTYDVFGNLLTAQLNCCQNKTWSYSSATNYSQPDSITRGSSPTQLTTSATYNAYTGQAVTSTDENGQVTNYYYDLLRRPTSVVRQADSATVIYTYDDVHFTATTKTPIDSSKSVQEVAAMDGLGRAISSTTEDGSSNVISIVSTQYNLAGRAYKTSNPYTTTASYWTTTAFDLLGRPTTVTLPDNSATTYSYTTNTTTVTDPTGKQSKSQSDAASRLAILFEPDPTNSNQLTLQTSYTYNVLGALTQIIQGVQTRTYTYDALGRLLSATTPEAGRVCLGSVTGSTCNTDGYDSFDDLLKRTDARGVLTNYGYDTLNRLTSVSYNVGTTGVPATATVSLTYGTSTAQFNNGRLVTMTDGPGSETYMYNNLGQMTQLQKTINGTNYTTQYAYNLANELRQITYPSNRVVQQSVDAIGRLCEVAPSTTGCGMAASPFATGFGYNAASQVTGLKYGNGIYASLGFSADRLQLNCLDYSTTNRNGTCAHDSTTKFGLNYSYGSTGSNNSQIAGITDSVDNGRSAAYTYDALFRLSAAVTTGSTNYTKWGLSWTYDRYGNALAETQTYGSPAHFSVSVDATSNHITGSPYSYDANGNMTNDGNNTLVYDAENHAVSASNGGSSGAYTYDGNGLRVKKVSGSTTTVYIFSGAKVIAEYVNGVAPASPSREYIYSGSALLAKIDSSGTKYYHQDHLSNRLVTDSSGNTVAQMGHFPYGESWYNASGDKLLFTSYERDSESGNDYAQARYNVSRLARFSSPDQVAGNTADPQSLNRYSYVRNMPVMLTDPSGLYINCVAQNRDAGARQETPGGGLSMAGSEGDLADPDPEPWSGCGGGGGGWGGMLFLDGGDIYDNSGSEGMGFPIGGGDAWALMRIPVFGPAFLDEGWSTHAFLGIGLFFPPGFPGGPSGPGGASEAQKKRDLIKAALAMKNLSSCLHKFFGPGTILTNANVPAIDASKDLPGATFGQTDPANVPDSGRATIQIDKGIFTGLSAQDPVLIGTYLHETANVLATQRFTMWTKPTRAKAGPLGGPPTDAQKHSYDHDIGEQFEKCIFAN